jgi:hypothetical protein
MGHHVGELLAGRGSEAGLMDRRSSVTEIERDLGRLLTIMLPRVGVKLLPIVAVMVIGDQKQRMGMGYGGTTGAGGGHNQQAEEDDENDERTGDRALSQPV